MEKFEEINVGAKTHLTETSKDGNRLKDTVNSPCGR